MMDALHRILTGQTLSRRELAVGGAIIAVWFLMDLAQWVDWAVGKFNPAPSCTISAPAISAQELNGGAR